MPEVAAYLLESDAPEVETRASAVESTALEWLSSKGAPDPQADTGTFDSLSGGNGRFTWVRLETDLGRLFELRLDETSLQGQSFSTTVSCLVQPEKLSVYVTLAVTSTESVVVPVRLNPRCPAVVRQLLDLYPDWAMNGEAIGQGESIEVVGSDAGRALAGRLLSSSRALPVVVVSENAEDAVWSGLEKMLAYDLAGLAEVCRVNEYASWALTEVLGKSNSCYLGAVRLYWPTRGEHEDGARLPGKLWTASAMLSNDCDGKGLDRLRSELRRRIMGVAALAIVPPVGVREVKRQASRLELAALEQKAGSDDDWEGLAKLYASENDQLKEELESQRAEIAGLKSKVVTLEYALEHADENGDDVLGADDDQDEPGAPEPGEIRFYKKLRSTPTHDVFVRVKGCGHNSWQNSAGADKAKKGIERLEGRNDWSTVLHCGSCTGGGLWKVRW